MNDCYLNLLVSFRALFSADPGANLVNSKQTIGIILPDLSLLGYAVPVESFGIGLFVILFAYLIIELQSPNQKIPDRKTKCVIKTHINIKQNVIFGAKLKPV